MIREYIIKISDEIIEEEIADRPQELVRCQGCRNKECMGRGGQIVCGITGEQHAPDWYCKDGERGEEENEQ